MDDKIINSDEMGREFSCIENKLSRSWWIKLKDNRRIASMARVPAVNAIGHPETGDETSTRLTFDVGQWERSYS